MFTKKLIKKWNRTTELCVDVKTILRSDCISQIGKDYPGVLKRDSDNDDGSLRLNFKPIRVNESFSVEQYADDVSGEIIRALEGLVEK